MAIALALGSVVWASAVLLAPLLAGMGRGATGLLYALGAAVCHQRPDRSFHWVGVQLPVCARCTGVYIGAAVGALAWLLLGGLSRPRPTAADRARASRPSTRTPPAPESRVRCRARDWIATRECALLAVALLGAPTFLTAATAGAGLFDPPNLWRALLAVPLGAIAALVVGAVASGHLK
jgi:hypothetical protein